MDGATGFWESRWKQFRMRWGRYDGLLGGRAGLRYGIDRCAELLFYWGGFDISEHFIILFSKLLFRMLISPGSWIIGGRMTAFVKHAKRQSPACL